MTDTGVTTVESGPRRVSRRVVVNAPVAVLFDMVANPHRHPELDGSGTVRDSPVTGPERLAEGATFKVAMKQLGLPYSITSTVTGFEENRLVEWRHPGGHHWRWEFSPAGPERTEVTETFDYRGAKAPRLLELLGQPGANAKGISATLAGLVARYA